MDKSVFNFLDELAINNNRQWFTEHKSVYENAKNNTKQLFEQIHNSLSKYDDFHEMKMYRIYTDIRFSKDKLPYKTHFSAIYKRKQPYNRGSFYVHIQSGNSMIGGGFWGPEKEDLYALRKAIEFESEIDNILNDKTLSSRMGEIHGEGLKTIPRGFDIEHERAHLIKMKQFLFKKSYTDEEVLSKDFIENVVLDYQSLQPFFRYFTDILTTDANGESLI